MANLALTVERKAFSVAIDAALKSLNKDREKGLLQIVDLTEKFMGDNFRKEAYDGVRKMIQNPDHKWMRYVNRLLDETDPHVAKMTALNLGFQAAFYGTKTIRKMREVHDCNIPWLILMDPTSACNLHCTGCWAAEYGNKLNLSFDELDSIVTQGKELGIYTYFITVPKDPAKVLPLIRSNPDCAVILLCDTSDITEDFAETAETLNNLLFAVTYGDQAETACLILRDHQLLYSLYNVYSDESSSDILCGTYFRFAEEMHSLFAAVLAEPDCTEETCRSVYQTVENSRISQFYRTVPLDFFYDTEKIGNIISSPASIVGFDADGTLYAPGRVPLKTSCNFFPVSYTHLTLPTILRV